MSSTMAVLNSVVVVTSTSPVLLISLVTVKLLVIVTLLFEQCYSNSNIVTMLL